jgi:hypothetical protein
MSIWQRLFPGERHRSAKEALSSRAGKTRRTSSSRSVISPDDRGEFSAGFSRSKKRG